MERLAREDEIHPGQVDHGRAAVGLLLAAHVEGQQRARGAAEQQLGEWQQGLQAMQQCRQHLEAEIALTGDLRKTLETSEGFAKSLEETVELEEQAMGELLSEKLWLERENGAEAQALWERDQAGQAGLLSKSEERKIIDALETTEKLYECEIEGLKQEAAVAQADSEQYS